MVDMGRGATDCVKVLQQKSLAIICPLAQNPCLKYHEEVSASSFDGTYQCIPLLNIIYCINTSTGIACEHKDFNSM